MIFRSVVTIVEHSWLCRKIGFGFCSVHEFVKDFDTKDEALAERRTVMALICDHDDGMDIDTRIDTIE